MSKLLTNGYGLKIGKHDNIKGMRCPECGLRIRCGDKSRHDEGLHHKRRVISKK